MANGSKSLQGGPAQRSSGSARGEAGAPAKKTPAATGSQREPNLTIALSYDSGSVLSSGEIDSIKASVTGPCGERKSCPQSINGQTPGFENGNNGISFPLAVQSERSLRIELEVHLNDGSIVKAEPILAYVPCDQAVTVNSVIRRNNQSQEVFTEVMVHCYWCDGEESSDRESQELELSEATATMTLDETGAPPAKPAQPVRATVRDDIAIFRLKSNATYRISAKTRGAEANSADTSLTVPAQSGSLSLNLGMKRAKRAVVLIFLNSQGQLAHPGAIFEESQGLIHIEPKGIATVYPKDEQSLRFISSSVQLSPDTIPLNGRFAGRESEAEAYIVRFVPIAGAKTNLQELEEEFFLLDGLLAGATVEVVDMEGALIARLLADSSGTCKFPIDAKDAVYDFKYIHDGQLVDQVRLRASKQPALQSGS
jgi:hypothetical protein